MEDKSPGRLGGVGIFRGGTFGGGFFVQRRGWGGGATFGCSASGGGKEAGEGETGVGRGEEGGNEGGRVGIAEGEKALIPEEAGQASQRGFKSTEGSQVRRLTGSGEAMLGKVEDNEAEKGNLFIETGNGGGAGVIIQLVGFEFTGVKAVLESIGVTRRSAAAVRIGHRQREKIAQMFYYYKRKEGILRRC
jgi:hypothetical protein